MNANFFQKFNLLKFLLLLNSYSSDEKYGLNHSKYEVVLNFMLEGQLRQNVFRCRSMNDKLSIEISEALVLILNLEVLGFVTRQTIGLKEGVIIMMTNVSLVKCCVFSLVSGSSATQQLVSQGVPVKSLLSEHPFSTVGDVMFPCSARLLIKKQHFISQRNLNWSSGAKDLDRYRLFLLGSVSIFHCQEMQLKRKHYKHFHTQLFPS